MKIQALRKIEKALNQNRDKATAKFLIKHLPEVREGNVFDKMIEEAISE